MMQMQFNSFDEFFETMSRGNEVILEYNSQTYSITPEWQQNCICGFSIGKCNDSFQICKNKEELEAYKIDGQKFIDVFDSMSVVDRVL